MGKVFFGRSCLLESALSCRFSLSLSVSPSLLCCPSACLSLATDPDASDVAMQVPKFKRGAHNSESDVRKSKP